MKNTEEIHPDCPRVPSTAFGKVGLDAKAGAAKFGQLVTLGDMQINADPNLISAMSQTVRDDQITDALICAARKRNELTTPEQIDHAWKVARFYRMNPSPADAISFHAQNPFPSTRKIVQQSVSNDTRNSLRKLIADGYALKEGIEREYYMHRREKTFEANQDRLIGEWNQRAGIWHDEATRNLQMIDPIARARFSNYQGLPYFRIGENVKWSNLNNWLNHKLDFLNQYVDKLD
ncbi:hypothetical protein FBQ96_00840 [Nitrospirales bacterium NOB]|nr:hypothetical protein [Nitrospirales bacterium NOB]